MEITIHQKMHNQESEGEIKTISPFFCLLLVDIKEGFRYCLSNN